MSSTWQGSFNEVPETAFLDGYSFVSFDRWPGLPTERIRSVVLLELREAEVLMSEYGLVSPSRC